MMPLSSLISPSAERSSDPPISSLASDSRKVAPGALFFAVPGSHRDGADFISQAVVAGAAAIVGEGGRPASLDPAVSYIQTPDIRAALAEAASRFYPLQPETVVAVTGTSGKSSVADFTRQIFSALGQCSASLGTLGIVTADGASYGSLTTPDPISLHESLQRLAEGNVTHLAMEASSHGIEQKRLDGVRLVAAGFTNLGRDHLDYHGTMERYLQAKLRLFETLVPEGGAVVVNADGDHAQEVIASVQRRGLRLVTTGQAGETLRVEHVARDGFDQRLIIAHEHRRYQVQLPLAGAFQVENALVAAGFALILGHEPEAVVNALSLLKGVPGRLERVAMTGGALCIVDYAHKPEALAHALDALRPFASNRLVCIFGCGGDRDKGKRPIMGRIAAEKADLVIVTDDNPRSENPASIRAEILAGAPGAIEIPDRAEAIRQAVSSLAPGDVLVVAGKGHETGQTIGDRVLPFSDHEQILAATHRPSR